MLLLAVSLTAGMVHAQKLPKKKDVLKALKSSNDYWQANHPAEKWAFWDIAAYHTGNMEAYKVTKNPDYLAY